MQLTHVVLLSCTILVAFAASTLPVDHPLATLGDNTEASAEGSGEAPTQDESGSQSSLSDAEETRFIEVNYCNSTQEEIIRKSAAEAKRIIIKTLDILKVLLEQFGIENVPPENNDKLGYQFQTYLAFWHLHVKIRERTPEALQQTEEDMDSLVRFLEKMISQLRETSAVFEITCNTPWLIKAPRRSTRASHSHYLKLIGNWANETGHYVHEFLPLVVYDNRTSIDPETPDDLRFSTKFVRPENVGMVDPENLLQRRLPGAVWRNHRVGPFPDAIALNATYLSSWKDPYKGMGGMNWVSSLDDINTRLRASSGGSGYRGYHRVPENVYSLEDILHKSLTGVFLNLFPRIGALQGVAFLGPYDEEVQYFPHTRASTVAYERPSTNNFAYLAMSLYLNEWQWTTNGNRIPRDVTNWKVIYRHFWDFLRALMYVSQLSGED